MTGPELGAPEDEPMVARAVHLKMSSLERLTVIAAERGITPSAQLAEWAEAQIAAHTRGDDGGVVLLKPLLEFIRAHRIAP